MDRFANSASENRDETFDEAAEKLGLSKAIVEKDFWVCWCLKQLFALPSFGDQLIFKGGTSLSKAHDVIHRFSEDVDLSLDRARLGFYGSRDSDSPKLSGNKRKALLQDLQDKVEEVVSGQLRAEICGRFNDRLKQEFAIEADTADAQTLLFFYPSAAAFANSGIQPFVRLEFGARGVHLPAEISTISPYVQKIFPDLMNEGDVDVKVLGIERTFWEKATILHMLYHQDPAKPLADRMSRHHYDMAMLIRHETKSKAMKNVDLLGQVAHHKSIFFKAAWAEYENAKPGTLRLVPTCDLAVSLRNDYWITQEMIFGDAPSFDEILTAIQGFEEEINAETYSQD